jgi:hypothetical protein
MESRKYRSSSTTETNDVFGIGFWQFARTATLAACNSAVALTRELCNVRRTVLSRNAAARKLWLTIEVKRQSRTAGEKPDQEEAPKP